MTYRPPPVRLSKPIFRVLAASGRKRQAQAFILSMAALCAAASANATPGTVASKQAQAQEVLAQIQQHRAELRKAHSEQQTIVAQKVAQKQRIESQLASRRQLLSSIKGEIARIRAAEEAQQRQLAVAARSRLAGAQVPVSDGVGVSASTPEGSIVAPPNVHGGVVGIAMRYLGVPYVWGGSTPRGFDCSGFVAYVFAQIGVSLPHSSYSMYGMGTPVSISQLQPGDLVFFTGASHMGIYIGGGQFIHSPHTGDVVKISSMPAVATATAQPPRRAAAPTRPESTWQRAAP